MKHTLKHIMFAVMFMAAIVSFRPSADALKLKDFFKTISTGLNDAINAFTANHKMETRQMTKVVPILSLGQGESFGAAQVCGKKELVGKVRAAFLLEGKFKSMNGKVLIPVNTTNPTKVSRVDGVGICAILDIDIDLSM